MATRRDEAVELVTRPLEDIIKGINGVEHVYSQTQDDHVVVTARFFVGTRRRTTRSCAFTRRFAPISPTCPRAFPSR